MNMPLIDKPEPELPAITRLPESTETALLYNIMAVSLFLEQTKPIGWTDEIGCALLQSLHPELEIATGHVDFLAVHPDPADPTKIQLAWIGGERVKGYWLELDGHIIDPFADERMRSLVGPQSRDWFSLPIVMRSVQGAPYDIIHHRSGTLTPIARHKKTRAIFDSFIARGDLGATHQRRDVLSNRGLRHIAETSRWAEVALLASIAEPPALAETSANETSALDQIMQETNPAPAFPPPAMFQRKPIDWEWASIVSVMGSIAGLSILALMKFVF